MTCPAVVHPPSRISSPGAALAIAVLAIVAGCGGPAARKAAGEIAAAVESSLQGGTESFDHAAWDRLLAGGTRDGLVDYGFMRARRDDLDGYLERIAVAPLQRLAPPHLEALLINAYNAYTVQSILDHPGVASIRDIPGVWTRRTHRVGGFDLTLDDIEHRLLRPFFRDPRIHFAVNCASRSCAPLPPWAVDGARINEQLEESASVFLRDPGNVRFESGTLRLSRYFDWYRDDFVAEGWRGAAATVPEYVARYATEDVARRIRRAEGRIDVDFLEYDWSLNAAPPAPPGTGTGF